MWTREWRRPDPAPPPAPPPPHSRPPRRGGQASPPLPPRPGNCGNWVGSSVSWEALPGVEGPAQRGGENRRTEELQYLGGGAACGPPPLGVPGAAVLSALLTRLPLSARLLQYRVSLCHRSAENIEVESNIKLQNCAVPGVDDVCELFIHYEAHCLLLLPLEPLVPPERGPPRLPPAGLRPAAALLLPVAAHNAVQLKQIHVVQMWST